MAKSPPGTHYLWVRGIGTSADSNEIHAGIDGVASVANVAVPSPWNQLNWSDGSHTLTISSVGNHEVNIWM
ncbi:MAG: hypothetical protein GXP16_14375, partial [Gammaproteobacteria bacterium]|nr:hypothetical protein [Gammaproteobacteria bacterium]